MSPALVFTVQGAPVPCARVRVVRGHAFTPERSREYAQRVRDAAEAAASLARWTPAPGAAFELRLDVYRAARRGDFDNFAKAIADGLTRAGVWDDDRRVEVAHVRLFVDRVNPRAEVEVRALSPAIPPPSADVDTSRARGGRNGSRVVRIPKRVLRVTEAPQ